MTAFRGTLKDERSGIITFRALWRKIRPLLEAGSWITYELTDGRTHEQENLAHSCFKDLARDALLAGKPATAAKWKISMKSAFWLATKDDEDLADDWKGRAPEEVPLPDGNGYVMSPVDSKRFTKRLYSHFITFIHSVGDARGVQWSKTSLGRDWPDQP